MLLVLTSHDMQQRPFAEALTSSVPSPLGMAVSETNVVFLPLRAHIVHTLRDPWMSA
jgi:hypothetical protein